MFDRHISIIDRIISNTDEYLIDSFTPIVWKNSIVRPIFIINIVMVAPQRGGRSLPIVFIQGKDTFSKRL